MLSLWRRADFTRSSSHAIGTNSFTLWGLCIICFCCMSLAASLPFDDAYSMMKEGKTNLIDIRDIRELQNEGKVEGAIHIPRGMLEFWLDPNSIYFKEGKLDQNKELVLFCAGGLRSALAAKSLMDMGFKKVSHIEGGFGSLKNSKFKKNVTVSRFT